MGKKRSLGVLLFGVAIIIFSTLPIIGLRSSTFTNLFWLSLLIAGFGIVALKNWARVLAIILLSISFYFRIVMKIIYFNSIVNRVMEKFSYAPKIFVIFLIGACFLIEATFLILAIVFLARPKVKEQFK